MDVLAIVGIVSSSIAAIAMVVLVFITRHYAQQTEKLVQETKVARRDDPELRLSVHDPPDDEWQVDVSRTGNSDLPTSPYLRLKAILVNPGLVPVVITSVEETFADEKGSRLTSSSTFVLPKRTSPEGYGIYVFGLPWVIRSDDFAIWYRTFGLGTNKGEKYLVKLTFNYEVAGRPKSVTKQIELNPH